MAKKKSFKGKKQYATYKAESRLLANRKRKLAKHLKAHPNDAQAERAVGRPKNIRKAAGKAGHPPKKVYVYDGAGNKTLMPSFSPRTKVGS